MVEPDPKHEQAREAFVRLEASEAKRRMGITDYRNDAYVASEVLASVVRARFGQHNGALDVAASALLERVVRLVGAYLHKNSQWHGVTSSSSETQAEIVSEIWDKLLSDRAVVCFAEVRFLVFLEARIEDYLRGRLRQKNQAMSLDAMHARDERGSNRPYAELIEDETVDTPEVAAIREQTSAALNRALLALEPQERHAVYLRKVCDLDWEKMAKFMGCSITTAKKHLKRGLEKLRGVQV